MSDDNCSPQEGPPSRYPTKAEDWLCRVENRLWGEIEKLEPRPDDHALNSALVGVGFALVEVRDELRRMNEGRDQFLREVLEVLTQAKAEAPLRCEVCGKAGHVPKCIIGPLTYQQWKAHYASLYQDLMNRGGYKAEAVDKMRDNFGPCPPKEGP